jgi:hypothetical protein
LQAGTRVLLVSADMVGFAAHVSATLYDLLEREVGIGLYPIVTLENSH